jgi:hypothetical protein
MLILSPSFSFAQVRRVDHVDIEELARQVRPERRVDISGLPDEGFFEARKFTSSLMSSKSMMTIYIRLKTAG